MFTLEGSLWMSHGRWIRERSLGKGVQGKEEGDFPIIPTELMVVSANRAVAMQLEREEQAGVLFREWNPLNSVATLSGRVTDSQLPPWNLT